MSVVLAERLGAVLAELPDTSGGIADFLIDRGVRGRREACNSCPMARWLRTALAVPFAQVNGWITVADDQDNRVTVPTPRSVSKFALHFDLGEYAELIDDGPPTDEEAWMDKYGDLE